MTKKPRAAASSQYVAERDVAAHFACSTRTVRGWRAAGVLKGVRLPSRSGHRISRTLIRYRRSDVEAFEARIWGEEVR